MQVYLKRQAVCLENFILSKFLNEIRESWGISFWNSNSRDLREISTNVRMRCISYGKWLVFSSLKTRLFFHFSLSFYTTKITKSLNVNLESVS